MNMNGITSSGLLQHLQQIASSSASTSSRTVQQQQTVSDADNDGDTDGAGPDVNDGRGQYINVQA